MTTVEVNTNGALLKINATQRDIQSALRSSIEPLSLIVERFSKEALTEGPTRAIRSGFLRGSVRSAVSNLRGIIKPNTNYAGFIHEGTGRMRARPYMARGVELAVPSMQRELENRISSKLN